MLLRKLMLAALMAVAVPAMALAATVEVTVKNNSTSGTASLGSIICNGCTPSPSTSISSGTSKVFTANGNTITGFLQLDFKVTRGTNRTCRASISVNFDPATGAATSVAGGSGNWFAESGTPLPTCTQTSTPSISQGKVLWNLSFVAN